MKLAFYYIVISNNNNCIAFNDISIDIEIADTTFDVNHQPGFLLEAVFLINNII